MSPIVVLDNGASTIKAGLVISGQLEPDSTRIIPNAVVRSKGDKMTYFGHELDRCKDYSSLHYRLPMEKGYLVDWDAQKAVWDGLFSEEVLDINTTESSLLITEPYFNLPNIQEIYDQFVFEEYEFQAYHRCTPASVIAYGGLFARANTTPECMVVIDSGFSFTHVVPLMDGKVFWPAVKRLDVGGKLLTNHLKELVSFRQWNMMDETYIMNHVKEACCFVSNNFRHDLETCRLDPNSNPVVQEYILPDLTNSRQGRIRHPNDLVTDADQILVMNNECFTVPEVIFRPDDIGMEQPGLPATIAFSISLLPKEIQGMFWANIGLIGGNTMLPGFCKRLFVQTELRSLAPVDCEVFVYESTEPITEAYRAAVNFAATPEFTDNLVTRAEYAEFGSSASRRKFHDWKSSEAENERMKETAKSKGKQREDIQGANRPTRTRSKTNASSTRRR
ncbi:actin-related protein Arp6 [Infundibulicybe gibba]|nr:actin-related protein Arp6 [Infundibulicybe gibba]